MSFFCLFFEAAPEVLEDQVRTEISGLQLSLVTILQIFSEKISMAQDPEVFQVVTLQINSVSHCIDEHVRVFAKLGIFLQNVFNISAGFRSKSWDLDLLQEGVFLCQWEVLFLPVAIWGGVEPGKVTDGHHGMFVVQSFKVKNIVFISSVAKIFEDEEFWKVVFSAGSLAIFFIELLSDVVAVKVFRDRQH